MKNTVFIVEDNKDIGFILTCFLSEEGFDVSLFPTIAEFNQTFPARLPDVFLVDVMLPDGDGISLCHEIKRDERTQQIPVIMMSAHAPLEEMEKACADDFISKPFDLYLILDRLKKKLYEN